MRFSANSKKSKIVFGLLGGLLALTILLIVFLFGPLLSLRGDLARINQSLRPAKDALLLYDLDKLSESIVNLQTNLNLAKNDAAKLKIFSLVPFLGGYVSDLMNLTEFSTQAGELSLKTIQLVKPFAPSLGFKTASSKEALAGGQERLIGLAKAAPVLAQEIPNLKKDISSLNDKLKNLDPGRYPLEFRGKKIRSTLESLKETVSSLSGNLDDLAKLFSVLPSFMGVNGAKNYLVIFQNDKELRPSGGFLTAYAVFTLDKGRISAASSADSYFIDIDNKLSFYDPAPAIVTKYLKLSDNKLFFRDSNLSPDFKVSMEAVEKIWNRSNKVPKVDGVIGLDTHFVESMLEVLGEVNIAGYPKFTKDNIVYELELFSSIRGSKLEKRQGRKDLIGLLMQQLMQKAFSAGGKQYINLINVGWREAAQKHLLGMFHNQDMQSLVEKYNFAGRIISFDGDYLHINDANFAGKKGNWYIKEEVTKEMTFEGNKAITTLKIDYENTGKYDADLNTGYRDYVRVFVPTGSKLVSSDGSREEVTTGQDLGKTFFAGYMAVDPLQKTRLTLKYETPKSDIIKNNIYKLLVQKQPGTDRFRYTVRVGNKTQDFDLLTDKEVDFKL